MVVSSPPSASPAKAVRHMGRFQLLRLLGKSERTMSWLVMDPRVHQEMVLVLPRAQLMHGDALAHWTAQARKVARLQHPGLAHVVEVGEHDRWPYIAYDRGTAVTLGERLGSRGLTPSELVPGLIQALGGLAYAHEAGILHHDLQLSMLQWAENGGCRLMGLGVALPPAAAGADTAARRPLVERDVLALGVVLHQALTGAPSSDRSDINQVMGRMAPAGREVIRLPRSGVGSIAEGLRAIVNRATDRQERQRYRSARTFERALAGWLRADGEPGGGPLAMLADRIRTAGLLPAMPGCQARADRLDRMDRQRTIELAEIVLRDVALSFELIRAVNKPRTRGALGGGSGPLLTVRRAIAMVGLDGVRRAARGLKAWPGALAAHHVAEMAALMARVALAGQVAQALRPRGYDPELVYVLALLQNLGRLVVQYHWPDDMAQIRRLMLTCPAARAGEPDEPGMSEESAAYAVLGIDVEALGHALGRQWGLDDAALQMMRRLPRHNPVHGGERDVDLLRMTASCANEVVDAQGLPQDQRAAAWQQIAQRYGRPLGVSLKDIQLAAAVRGAGQLDGDHNGPAAPGDASGAAS